MTKKQQCVFTDTQEIATQENLLNGTLKKLYGTWSGIDTKSRKLYWHLRLWKWAAMYSPDFKYFEISYTRIIRITTGRTLEGDLVVSIRLQKPHFYMFEPMQVVVDFVMKNDIKDPCLNDIDFSRFQ